MMRIGIDLDGVLADFVTGYAALIKQLTGKDVPLVPESWNWVRNYGVTREDEKKVWDFIKGSNRFWMQLRPLGDPLKLYDRLAALQVNADLYFITSRPGDSAKWQTENWLKANFPIINPPTVLIDTGGKGVIARGLGLTHFIDDRPENIEDVAVTSPGTKLFLRNASYNQDYLFSVMMELRRVKDFMEFGSLVLDESLKSAA